MPWATEANCKFCSADLLDLARTRSLTLRPEPVTAPRPPPSSDSAKARDSHLPLVVTLACRSFLLLLPFLAFSHSLMINVSIISRRKSSASQAQCAFKFEAEI